MRRKRERERGETNWKKMKKMLLSSCSGLKKTDYALWLPRMRLTPGSYQREDVVDGMTKTQSMPTRTAS